MKEMGEAFVCLFGLLLLMLPLALWKLIEIIVWLFTHVKVGFE